MIKKILFIAFLLTSSVPKTFAYDICYIGKQDNLYIEIIKRGYSIKENVENCDMIVVNSDTSIRLEGTKWVNVKKIIFINAPPRVSCAYRVNHTLKNLGKGKLTIPKYNIEEELDELEAFIFDKSVMKTLGNHLILKDNKSVNVAFMKRHYPIEYYAFDITESEKLMDALFPKIQESAANPVVKQLERKMEKSDKDDYDFKQKIMLSMLFGLLLNIPFCILVFTSGALEQSNRSIVYNFLIGRALGLLVIGVIFIRIVSYFQAYKHLFTIGFGIMCLGIAISIYIKNPFSQKAFSYTGGFIKGITPCMKLTPVFPLLIGASLLEGIIIMFAFIVASTIYFFLLFLFGVKLLKRFNRRLKKKYTFALFLLLGLYFIGKGLHIL
jgi:hypothetical protein